MKNFIVEFDFVLRVGGINECGFKIKIIVAAYFFKFSRKLAICGAIWNPVKDFFRPPSCASVVSIVYILQYIFCIYI